VAGEDDDEGCECAGTDDDGEPLGCNCAAGCVCDACSYHDYARYKRCWAGSVSIGTYCGAAPRFRVVANRVQSGYVQEPTRDGAVCPHPEGTTPHYCTPDTVYYEAGLKQQTVWFQPACSVAHAHDLINADRKLRGEKSGLQYYIERWTYTPHERELPAPLPQVHTHVGGAHVRIGQAITHFAQHHSPGVWLKWTRESLALAAWHANHPLDLDDLDDDPVDVRDDQDPEPVCAGFEPTTPDAPR
jgi:hypothetical protein